MSRGSPLRRTVEGETLQKSFNPFINGKRHRRYISTIASKTVFFHGQLSDAGRVSRWESYWRDHAGIRSTKVAGVTTFNLCDCVRLTRQKIIEATQEEGENG